MKRGYGIILILVVVCAAGLFYSSTVWKSKIQEASATKPEQIVEGTGDVSDSDPDSNTVSDEESPTVGAPSLEPLNASLGSRVKEVFSKKFEAGEQVKLLVIGSDAIDPVVERFGTAFHESFNDWVTIDAVSADLTSTEFVQQGLAEVDWSSNYDIVIYEPFTLKNNGVVVIEKEQQDLMAVRNRALEANDQTVFMVTPPQPIYEANYYQTQIQALKKFAGSQNLIYIDHWSDWPSTSSSDLLNYVDKERKITSRGVKVWSDALIHTFLQ